MENFDPVLLAFFRHNDLSYDYYEHEPLFTVEQSKELKTIIPWLHTKNLFLTDKKGQYFLVCIEASKRLPINQFRKAIHVKDMTFASPEDLKELLNLTPWSVSLFWLINTAVIARNKAIHLYFDKDIRNSLQVGRHPNRNDATVVIDHETLEKYVAILGFEINLLDIQEESIALVSI